MADSPSLNTTVVIDVSIAINGNELSTITSLRSVEIDLCVNKIAKARLHIEDGDMPSQSSAISDGKDFVPGAEIKISVAYNNQKKQSVFEGIILRHGMKIDTDGHLLVVDCVDKAISMTVGRKNANYTDNKNSDIISTIVSSYSSLSYSGTASSTVTYPELVQFNSTDWDFVIARAETSGLVLLNRDNKIELVDPTKTKATLDVNYGQDIISFEAKVDALPVYQSVNATSWDPAKQTVSSKSVKSLNLNKPGNLTASDLAKVIDLSEFRLQSNTPLDPEGLNEWANAQQVKSALAQTIGHVQFQGNATVSIGDAINLIGLGDRFNGEVFVSAVNHVIEDGDWLTKVSFGLEPGWFSEENNLQSAPAAGLLPGAEGLVVGKVLKLEGDPANENRIQVSVPVLETETPGVWARIIQYYASAGFGHFFMPEVGDEVVLGYFNNDPSNPVILGSVYSSKNAPPITLEEANNIKTLVTRSQHKFEFDDDKKTITLTTPAGNQVVFSDDEKSVTIKDQTDNSITLDTSGITLDSPKDINIQATGDITLDAKGKVDISAVSDVSCKGMNVSVNAQAELKAQGTASAELSAAGQTTIKGAMVMIN